jgi:hypothetical protein
VDGLSKQHQKWTFDKEYVMRTKALWCGLVALTLLGSSYLSGLSAINAGQLYGSDTQTAQPDCNTQSGNEFHEPNCPGKPNIGQTPCLNKVKALKPVASGGVKNVRAEHDTPACRQNSSLCTADPSKWNFKLPAIQLGCTQILVP